jgi:hypothetical protein
MLTEREHRAMSEPRDPRLERRSATVDEVLRSPERVIPSHRAHTRFRLEHRGALSDETEVWVLLERQAHPPLGTRGPLVSSYIVRHVRCSPEAGPVEAFGAEWQGGCEYTPGEGIHVRDREVPSALATSWQDKLAALRLPLVAEEILGCDGETFTLTTIMGFSSATLSWWCDGPQEWRALHEWATMFRREAFAPTDTTLDV